ncbi:ubiquitin carboxyl-terminal hydrolase 20 isoform X2 [Aethina tumida]|uniref:ubiquitin carboxyl-terminal hydrolase 20 isoform X2 n=1 Tax=Aethina tumida TaxID=116153 RepID=UPI00096B0E36|nr:ubiquitin carboxyl-terminal hydrolase 20 isoform X2 [Aethina tumida]
MSMRGKMVNRSPCIHLGTASDIPLANIINSIEKKECNDCEYKGPHLWICLYKNCLRIGCSDEAKDHSTLHNVSQPAHAVHMSISTLRLWCYDCKSEVFMGGGAAGPPAHNQIIGPVDSDLETDDDAASSTIVRAVDSGHASSYTTLRTESPDQPAYGTVGLNVGMGDASESSDEEESPGGYFRSEERPSGLIGLQNIGNTCYMNAALQALSNTEPLTKFFLDCPSSVHLLSEGRKPGLCRTYQSLMKDIWLKKAGGYVVPSGILYGMRNVHPMFRGYQQHDTQEFLRNFMDQLHEELKQLAAPDPSPTPTSEGDTFSLAMDEPAMSYDSSEGEYETCDSGVSERSSLSDDMERPASSAKRRLSSRCGSPNRRQRARVHSCSVIDSQPGTSQSGQTSTMNSSGNTNINSNINSNGNNNNNNNNNNSSSKKQLKYRSIISDIFDGKLLSSVQCLTCNRVSSRVETFQDLSLPIPSRDHLAVLHGRTSSASGVTAAPGGCHVSSSASAPPTCSEAVMPVQDGGWVAWILTWLRSWFYGPTVTLHDCLSAFFSTDELKGDNMYSCEKCNKLRNGIKFSKVLQLPEVLCIHLKRFRHELMFSSKISSAVSFPLRGLDMRPYLHADCTSKVSTYELFSVICHHGTAGGGHYICYALNSGCWYEFDDQYVTKVTPDKVQTCEAYVLFYRKLLTTAGDDTVKSRASRIHEERNRNNTLAGVTYVSRQWLNRFNHCAEPGPIDNSDFLCHHGAIDPERESFLNQLAITVPVELHEYLHSKYGGCPPLNNVKVCPACASVSKKIMFEMETIVKLTRDVHNYDIPYTHYLSTSWYTQWHNFVQKKTLEPPGPIDNSKINSMAHPEGNPEASEITQDMWNFFHGIYGGGPEIRIKQQVQLTANVSFTPTPTPAPPPSHVNAGGNGLNCEWTSSARRHLTTNDSQVAPYYPPTIKKDNSQSMTDLSVFSHGEPLVDSDEDSEVVIDKMLDNHLIEVEKIENGRSPINKKVISSANHPNVDDDIDDDEDVRNSSKHRRRRRNVTSL